MNSFVVLMYHALYDNEAELAEIDSGDRPYAVSVGRFASHLAAIRDAGVRVVSFKEAIGSAGAKTPDPVEGPAVLLTFDDGHASGYHHALPLLTRFDMRATFFVTTDFIGRRPGFASWSQLRVLREAGHSIESHGSSHHFLDDLTLAAVRLELSVSRDAIEQAVAHPVRAISFPGGRFRSSSLTLGKEAGYSHFFSSRVGVSNGATLPSGTPLPRLAIRHDTDAQLLARIARIDRSTINRLAFKAHAKRLVRGVVGNRIYHWAYRRGAS